METKTHSIIKHDPSGTFFAVTQGAGHWTNDRARAFRFATEAAAIGYVAERLKGVAGLRVEPSVVRYDGFDRNGNAIKMSVPE